jgi:hypothetical protein
LLTVAILAGGQAIEAPAQMPDAPAYLHAITDMRMARAYLQADNRPEFNRQKGHAIQEITAAINEIKKASIDDGKSPDWVPPTDTHGMASGPFHEALRLMRKAHEDCSGGMDMPNAIGMKFRALHHIDEARDTLDRMIRESQAF